MNYRFVDARSGEELNVRVAGEGADAGRQKAPYKAMTGALKIRPAPVIPIGHR